MKLKPSFLKSVVPLVRRSRVEQTNTRMFQCTDLNGHGKVDALSLCLQSKLHDQFSYSNFIRLSLGSIHI